jgi:hypothetical protein
VIVAAACRAPALPFPVDSSVARQVDRGVTERYLWSARGPWAIHVLDVDLSQCYSAVAVKGAPGAAGRKRTSQLLTELAASRQVVGGVNADFFSLNGMQGIPSGPLIENGRVIVGPGDRVGAGARASLSVDSMGIVRVGYFTNFGGTVISRAVTRPVAAWNRPAARGIAVYDANWGAALDTASGVVEVVLSGMRPSQVVRVDTAVAGVSIPANGVVLRIGRNAPGDVKQWAASLKPREIVDVYVGTLVPHPRDAVGGRPMLVTSGRIDDAVDTSGAASFRGRNPRTAVGLANGGTRLILAVVDGRQKPYSDGMTLRETAELMLGLGARDALNLDGGGSSALVYRDAASRSLRVANRPSDATGERAVGDVLAVVKGCR